MFDRSLLSSHAPHTPSRCLFFLKTKTKNKNLVGGVFVGPEEDGLRPILRQESFAPDAVKQAIEYVAKEGLLVKIFHEMPDGELGVSWCGDFVRSTSTSLIQATVRRDVKKDEINNAQEYITRHLPLH